MKLLVSVSFIMILSLHSSVEIAEKQLYTTKSEFEIVAKAPAFIDKTLMLASFFHGPEIILITAPHRFGKSTNLDMVRKFLAIKHDKNAEMSVRRIFEKLEISKNEVFFENHFGHYPVVYVEFKVHAYVTTFEDALSQYRFSIHNSYTQHLYLFNSTALSADDKSYYKSWCDIDSYELMSNNEVMLSLFNLVVLLKKHFSKNAIVLVDDCDSVINSALFLSENGEILRKIIALTSGIMSTLLKSNANVERGIITGVSYISGFGLSQINNLERYRFLDNHDFVDFYGFTKREVDGLFNNARFNLDPQQIESAHDMYDGYVSRQGAKIFNTFSVLKFLQNNTTRTYWNVNEYSQKIVKILRFPEIETAIDKLLNGTTINITFYDNISMQHLKILRNMYSENHVIPYRSDSDLLLSHLFDFGFLSHHLSNGFVDDTVGVKLPNKEVYNVIFKEFKEYYCIKCNLSRCAIRGASYVMLKEILKPMYEYNKYYGLKVFCRYVLHAAMLVVKFIFKLFTALL